MLAESYVSTPTGKAAECVVPGRFQSVFVFLNERTVDSTRAARPTSSRAWLSRSCRVARFESSEIIPRAIRGVAQSLFSDPLPYDELVRVWRFLQRILTLGRGVESDDFWLEVGRLPVPVSEHPFSIAPAFLSYWPDGHEKADARSNRNPRTAASIRYVPRNVSEATRAHPPRLA